MLIGEMSLWLGQAHEQQPPVPVAKQVQPKTMAARCARLSAPHVLNPASRYYCQRHHLSERPATAVGPTSRLWMSAGPVLSRYSVSHTMGQIPKTMLACPHSVIAHVAAAEVRG